MPPRPGPSFVRNLFTPDSAHEFSLAFVTTIKLLAFAHLLSTHVLFIHSTLGPSMLPTLSVSGDSVLISKRHRRGKGIRVGDVVEIRHPVPEYAGHGAVKRVLGLGGDFVVRGSPPRSGAQWDWRGGKVERMIQVPEGHCWIEGDNLPESRDSREYGPVPLALVKGKVLAKVWPLGEMKWIRNGLERVHDSGYKEEGID